MAAETKNATGLHEVFSAELKCAVARTEAADDTLVSLPLQIPLVQVKKCVPKCLTRP